MEWLQTILLFSVNHKLHSPHLGLLTIPYLYCTKKKTQNYGDKVFEKTVPELWNELPVSLQTYILVNSFKK